MTWRCFVFAAIAVGCGGEGVSVYADAASEPAPDSRQSEDGSTDARDGGADSATFEGGGTEPGPDAAPITDDGGNVYECVFRVSGQTCDGKCSGKCVMDSEQCDAVCVGDCVGVCENVEDGMCNGYCDGECKGQCVSDDPMDCPSECTGKCWVEDERHCND